MLQESYPFYLGNEPQAPNTDLEVTDKYRGEVATRVARANPDAIHRGIGAAVAAAVAQGRADWGVTIETVARRSGLGVQPLRPERSA